MEEWELSKENFIPVKQGRAKAVLDEAVVLTGSSSKEALEEKKRELWQHVRDYQGDDPIEPWQRLIKWTQEHLIGSSKAELQKILELCTSELVKTGKYNSDIRFLRVWIQYADCLPNPGDVFLFLRDKQVGQDFALYYEAYATYFELQASYPSADAVYQEGINRMAKPLERLNQKYTAFQNRMAQRIHRKIQDDALLGVDQQQLAPARTSLAALITPGAPTYNFRQQPTQASVPVVLGTVSRPSVFPFPQQQQQQQQHLVTPLFGRTGGSMFNPTPSTAHRVSAIAVDDEFSCSKRLLGSAQGPLSGFASMPQGAGNLKELKPYGVIRKENTQKPSIWTAAALGGPLPASSSRGLGSSLLGPPAAAVPITPARLEICVDDEFEDGLNDKTPPVPAPSNALRLALEGKPPPFSGGGFGLLSSCHRSDEAPNLPAVASALAPVRRGVLPPPSSLLDELSVPAQPPLLPRGSSQRSVHPPPSSLLLPQPLPEASNHDQGNQIHTMPLYTDKSAMGQGFDVSLLLSKDAEEMSFEEVRAMKWREQQRPVSPPQGDSDMDDDMDMDVDRQAPEGASKATSGTGTEAVPSGPSHSILGSAPSAEHVATRGEGNKQTAASGSAGPLLASFSFTTAGPPANVKQSGAAPSLRAADHAATKAEGERRTAAGSSAGPLLGSFSFTTADPPAPAKQSGAAPSLRATDHAATKAEGERRPAAGSSAGPLLGSFSFTTAGSPAPAKQSGAAPSLRATDHAATKANGERQAAAGSSAGPLLASFSFTTAGPPPAKQISAAPSLRSSEGDALGHAASTGSKPTARPLLGAFSHTVDHPPRPPVAVSTPLVSGSVQGAPPEPCASKRALATFFFTTGPPSCSTTSQAKRPNSVPTAGKGHVDAEPHFQLAATAPPQHDLSSGPEPASDENASLPSGHGHQASHPSSASIPKQQQAPTSTSSCKHSLSTEDSHPAEQHQALDFMSSAALKGRSSGAEALLDPTVTMSTRDAFDAINSMFGDSSYSSLGSAAQVQQPASSSYARWQEPPVTNAPPSDSLALQLPLSQPAAYRLAPPAGKQGIDKQQQQYHPGMTHGPYVHPTVSAPAFEPTVTMSTLAAFNAVNDMFSDQLPHEASRGETRKTARPSLPLSSKPISATDVCRLANAGSSRPGGLSARPPPHTSMPSAPSSALAIHEDTEFLPHALLSSTTYNASSATATAMHADTEFLPQSTGTAACAMYEDTQFLPQTGQHAATQSSKQPQQRQLGASNAPPPLPAQYMAPPEGMQMYEDTQFLPQLHTSLPLSSSRTSLQDAKSVSHNGHNTFQQSTLHHVPSMDDTGVLPGGIHLARADAVSVSSAMLPCGPAASSGGLCLYEDTEFITMRMPKLAGASGMEGLEEDTSMLSRQEGGEGAAAPGTFRGYQDTVKLAAALRMKGIAKGTAGGTSSNMDRRDILPEGVHGFRPGAR